MGASRSINLFLIDGKANGRLKATLANWNGVTYQCPRTDIPLFQDREDLKRTGIYLLFGKNDATGEDTVYIGQARTRKNGFGVLGRVKEHTSDPKKAYFTTALMLVTADDSYGPTEISWLEHHLTKWAIQAGRYAVANDNDPSPGNVTEEKEAELQEFAANARLVIQALGFPVFEPVDSGPQKNEDAPLSKEDTLSAGDVLLMTTRKSNAYGRQTPDGFVVLATSVLSPTLNPSCPIPARERRKALGTGIVGGVLMKDVLFPSPSAAASFVGGASLSGLEHWVGLDGTRLRDLERRDLNTHP